MQPSIRVTQLLTTSEIVPAETGSAHTLVNPLEDSTKTSEAIAQMCEGADVRGNLGLACAVLGVSREIGPAIQQAR